MNDIELKRVLEAARCCQEHKEYCTDQNGNLCDYSEEYSEKCFACLKTSDIITTVVTLADRLDALTAENAEKDRRIAELEAVQKHGKWVDDGRCCCKCTACGCYVPGNTSESLRRYNFRPYCENCGAKMDGE